MSECSYWLVQKSVRGCEVTDSSGRSGWEQPSHGTLHLTWKHPNYVQPLAPLGGSRLQVFGRQRWQQVSFSTVLGTTQSNTYMPGSDVNVGLIPHGWKVADSWYNFSNRTGYSSVKRYLPRIELPNDGLTDDLRALAEECDRLQSLIVFARRTQGGT